MDGQKYDKPAFDDTNIEEEQKKFINKDKHRKPNIDENEIENNFFDYLKRIEYEKNEKDAKK